MKEHTHFREDGTEYTHVHHNGDGVAESHVHHHDHKGAGHVHRHVHSAEEKKKVMNRLSRAIGHLEAVKRMVERDEDCSEVLIQLAAVKSAVNNTGKLVLKEHIAHCIVEAIENGDEESLRQLNKAIDSFVK